MSLRLLVMPDGVWAVQNLVTALTFVLQLMRHFVESPSSLPYRHMVTKTTWVVESSSVPNVMSMAIIRERGVSLGDDLHLILVEGSLGVTLEVVIASFDSQPANAG